MEVPPSLPQASLPAPSAEGPLERLRHPDHGEQGRKPGHEARAKLSTVGNQGRQNEGKQNRGRPKHYPTVPGSLGMRARLEWPA